MILKDVNGDDVDVSADEIDRLYREAHPETTIVLSDGATPPGDANAAAIADILAQVRTLHATIRRERAERLAASAQPRSPRLTRRLMN
jgi:hypothetical protein